MTKAIMRCGALIGAAGGGYLGYTFIYWLTPNPHWGILFPVVALAAVAGGLFGLLLGFIVAGLIEQ